jgi:hypothetical protein
MSYPFNGCTFQSLQSAPQRATPFRGFSTFNRAIQNSELRERLTEDTRLDQFLPRAAREEVVCTGRQRDVSLLWTLSVAAEWTEWPSSNEPEPDFESHC